MAVAGLLAQYMSIKNQLAYNQLQQTRWNDLATSMEKKLSQQEGYEGKWEDAYGKCEDAYDPNGNSSSLVYRGQTYIENGRPNSKFGSKIEIVATKYADAKVPNFSKEKLDEYADLDMEYQTMQNMYDALCT